MKLLKNKAVVAATCGMALLGAGLVTAGTASAEPTPPGSFRPLAGVGSDTTENVMNGLSEVITIGGAKQIASYNANGGGTILTQAGCAPIARPNGSGAGRTALLASLNANGGAGNDCLQFARSSSGKGSLVTSPSLTFIPFGIDALTFAARSDGDVPRSLTTAEMISVFKCEIPGFFPVLPQTGSGTRATWLTNIGVTEAQITAAVGNTSAALYCLTGAGNANSRAYQQENSATVLKTDEITPFSVAQYLSQSTGVVTDVRGKSVLGTIDGSPAAVLNNAVAFPRDVFNLIPTSKIAVAPWSTVFAGSGSLVCTNTNTIKQYGFLPNPNCGNTTSQS